MNQQPATVKEAAVPLIILCEENGVPIHSEERSDDAPVNLTDMWRAKGSDTLKRPWQWLRLPDTKEFLNAFMDLTPMCAQRTSVKSPVDRAKEASLVFTRKGGKNAGGGTWAHNEIAIEYARWLDKRLAVKINRVFKQVMLQEIDRLRRESGSLRVQYELFEGIEFLSKRRKVLSLLGAYGAPGKSMQVLCRHLKDETKDRFDPYPIKEAIEANGGRATLIGIIEANGHIDKALSIAQRMLMPAPSALAFSSLAPQRLNPVS